MRLDSARLAVPAPAPDADALILRLDGIARVVAGHPAAGAVARLSPSERFGWVTATSGTALQPSPIAPAAVTDPTEAPLRLLRRLVPSMPEERTWAARRSTVCRGNARRVDRSDRGPHGHTGNR